MREHPSNRSKVAMAIAGMLAIGGCQVGPDYRRPNIAIDAAFINAGSPSVDANAPTADITNFWRGFHDEALNSLVDHALVANGDVRIARSRLQEARATQAGAHATLLPEVDTGAGAGRALQPGYLYPEIGRASCRERVSPYV